MSDYGVKETACTRCVHRDVCSKKDIFMKARKTADGLCLYLRDENNSTTTQSISDYDWIRPIQLECKYYIKEMQNICRMEGRYV